MTKVVYLVGAGFSAPLGLPVMRDFVMKSKDMLASHPKEFGHFENIFALIKDMNAAKSYYSADLFNIEEILSILEMSERVGGRSTKRFIKYIVDVIEFYTPPQPETDPSRLPGNWYDYPIKKNRMDPLLIFRFQPFVGSITARFVGVQSSIPRRSGAKSRRSILSSHIKL